MKDPEYIRDGKINYKAKAAILDLRVLELEREAVAAASDLAALRENTVELEKKLAAAREEIHAVRNEAHKTTLALALEKQAAAVLNAGLEAHQRTIATLEAERDALRNRVDHLVRRFHGVVRDLAVGALDSAPPEQLAVTKVWRRADEG